MNAELLALKYQAHLHAMGKKDLRVEPAGGGWVAVYSKSLPSPPHKVRASMVQAEMAAGKPLLGKPALKWS